VILIARILHVEFFRLLHLVQQISIALASKNTRHLRSEN